MSQIFIMVRRLSLAFTAVFCVTAFQPALHAVPTDNHDQAARIGIQVTTKSAEARKLFEQGLAQCQTLHLREGFETWRKAAQADPHFALVHILLANFSPDPEERVAERQKALSSRKRVSQEEQLIIDWLSNASQGHFVPAIQAMNEALEKYGDHKLVVWLAGMWMDEQQQWARAIPLYERAIKLDPNFGDAWNSVAYCYARVGQFDRAVDAMKNYARILPNQPNPHDTLAEILLMAGKYEDALAEYRAALKIDPGFVESQRGIADTYALMGDEKRARAEYATAIARVNSPADAARWAVLAAATYVREGDWKGADAAFTGAATQAHESGFDITEAEAWRSMALYQKDSGVARRLLDRAEASLHEGHKIPQSLADHEWAAVLRTRVERAIQNGNIELASQQLMQLQALWANYNDGAIRTLYQAAAGAIALARGDYPGAIGFLDDNSRDVLSLRHLMEAYQKSGAKEQAQRTEEKLAGLNEVTIEQALVIPQLRSEHGGKEEETPGNGNSK
jgi:tetratricopeptide (TPR) repeat protein